MARVYNFSAGPSMLPESVLKKAAAEMLDYEGSGQSVMEMSFLQGGGSTQFAMVALNLMNKNNKADYIVTGQWAKKALQEAQRYGDAQAVASSADKTFTYIPKTDKSMFREDADYVYICLNNTIYGTVYHELPDTGDIPLVADISSRLTFPSSVCFSRAHRRICPAQALPS